jgi:hypothetical protein
LGVVFYNVHLHTYLHTIHYLHNCTFSILHTRLHTRPSLPAVHIHHPSTNQDPLVTIRSHTSIATVVVAAAVATKGVGTPRTLFSSPGGEIGVGGVARWASELLARSAWHAHSIASVIKNK